MTLAYYTEKTYQGRFNLKLLEKKLITSALKRTKDVQKLAALLRKPENEVLIAIIRHQIQIP